MNTSESQAARIFKLSILSSRSRLSSTWGYIRNRIDWSSEIAGHPGCKAISRINSSMPPLDLASNIN